MLILTSVCHEHPERNLALLQRQRPILLQDLDILQVREILLDKIPIVQLQQPLFHKLHTGNSRNQLGTRCDPEDGVRSHGLGAVESAFTRRVREQFAIFAHYDNTDAGDVRLRVRTCIVDGLSEVFENFGGERHVAFGVNR
jgi:hypothetical protein